MIMRAFCTWKSQGTHQSFSVVTDNFSGTGLFAQTVRMTIRHAAAERVRNNTCLNAKQTSPTLEVRSKSRGTDAVDTATAVVEYREQSRTTVSTTFVCPRIFHTKYYTPCKECNESTWKSRNV